jgi:hypothetical protein
VFKAGDRTFRRTAVKSKYSRTIHDEFINMFGREDRARNEGHCKKIWRVKERKGKSDLRERDKKKGESTQISNLETNDLLAKEVTNK